MKYLTIENNFIKYQHIKSVLKYGEFRTDIPTVSIIIPTYRRADVLKDAVNSALQQEGYNDYEVIVIDNDAEDNDEIEKIIRSYSSEKLFYYKNEQNLGMAGNWNRGIELARGHWITMLHDDDFLYPEFLQEAFKVIGTYEDIEVVLGLADIGTSEDLQKIRQNRSRQKKECEVIRLDPKIYLFGNVCALPTNMFRKDVAIKVGGFYESGYPIFDYAFWTQLSLRNKSFYIKQKLGFYRISDFNCTAQVNQKKAGLFRYLLKFQEEYIEFLQKDLNYNQIAEKFYYWGFFDNLIQIHRQYNITTIEEFEQACQIKLKYKSELERRSNSVLWKIGNRMQPLEILMNLEKQSCNYVLWGTGSSALKTKEMLDSLIPDFKMVAFIDVYRKGYIDQYPILKPEQLKNIDYDLIFICTSLGRDAVEKQLIDMGMRYGVNFLYGHGVEYNPFEALWKE